MREPATRTLAIILALSLPYSCGGSDAAPAAVAPGAEASQMIVAADGGTLKLDDHTSLTVPAGALGADTMLTLKTVAVPATAPNKETVGSPIYEFGPDGTQFSQPVQLALPAPTVPKDKKAVISWLDTTANAWVDLPSTIADGVIQAPVMHFTRFVIRFLGVATLDCSFGKCGGNLVGSWNISGACVDAPSANPFKDQCPTATYDAALSATGDITFNADLTYVVTLTNGGMVTLKIPGDCLAKFGVSTCDAFQSNVAKDGGSCTGTATGGCTCVVPQKAKTSTETGTYSTTADGTVKVIDPTAKPEDQESTLSYCVKGNTLKLQQSEMQDGGIQTVTYVGTKK